MGQRMMLMVALEQSKKQRLSRSVSIFILQSANAAITANSVDEDCRRAGMDLQILPQPE
jgi:hypothetical protein